MKVIQLLRVLEAFKEAGDIEPLLENSILLSALNSNQKIVRDTAEWIEGLAESKRDVRLESLINQDGGG